MQNELGNLLLESAYRDCLAHELRLRGHRVDVEPDVPLTYRGLVLSKVYRADLLVDGLVVVEVKATGTILAEHEAQAITYATLLGVQLAIVLDFHAPKIMDGFRRLAISQGLREHSAASAPLRGSGGS